MRRICLGIVLLTACGRLGFDRQSGSIGNAVGSDASDDVFAGGDSSTGDASTALADAHVCTWGLFSAPARLPGPVQTSSDDWTPATALGETVVFMQSNRNGSNGQDLFIAKRPDRTSQFAASTLISELSMAGDEGDPTLTEDGLVLVFSHGNASQDLWTASRASATDTWTGIGPLANVNSGAIDTEPWMSADGLRLVFASDRVTANDKQLYETTRPTRQSAFAAPAQIAGVNSGNRDSLPTLSQDGLELFFSSSRAGGPGKLDVYHAVRSAIGQPFSTPQLVPQLSSANDDYGLRLSFDGATMYFNYDTLTAGGRNADLWTATRTCN